MRQLTLRGFDKELQRRIRELARRERISLNQAALRLLRQGAGLQAPGPGELRVGSALDEFFGTWTAAQARRFEQRLTVFEQVDAELWK